MFKNAWNSHNIRTFGNKTPQHLWISGMLENINSSHTAVTEIFSERQQLYSRLLDSFTNGMDIRVLENTSAEEMSNSNLTMELPANAETSAEIGRILDSDRSDQLKYLEVLACLINS